MTTTVVDVAGFSLITTPDTFIVLIVIFTVSDTLKREQVNLSMSVSAENCLPVVSARYSMDLISSMAWASTTFGFWTPGICKGPRAGKGNVFFQVLLIARPALTTGSLIDNYASFHGREVRIPSSNDPPLQPQCRHQQCYTLTANLLFAASMGMTSHACRVRPLFLAPSSAFFPSGVQSESTDA